MTRRQTLDHERPIVHKAHELACKQAADLINKGALTPGEVVELYVGAGVGVALMFSKRSDISMHLRELADEIDAGSDLH